MNSENSINESLEIIRRALEEDKPDNENKPSSNILVLNQKVNDDGTIKIIQKSDNFNKEVNEIIDQKLNYLIEKRIEKIIDKKIPALLKTYLDSK